MFGTVSRKIFHWIGGSLRDKRGGTAMLIAFATLPLLAAGGLAIDVSLAYMLKNSMSRALDTAGLAAGRVAFETYAADDAEKFFNANFDPGQTDASLTSFSVSIDAQKENITLTASASMPTRFMHLVGLDTVDVTSRAVIVRANMGMELALVLDDTGSMVIGGRLDAAKVAAHDLIEAIYGTHTTLPNVWVSLVPYVTAVNIGTDRWGWLDPTDRAIASPADFGTPGWAGCVEVRAAPIDQDDTPPAGNPFTSYLYAQNDRDNDWPPYDFSGTSQTHPNVGCPARITSLTQSRATVDTAIDAIQPMPFRNGTSGSVGLSWGWRTISPAWRGLWNDETPIDKPLDYDEPLMVKVVVIMTDGQNQFYDWDGDPNPGGSDYTGYGRLNDFGFATLSAARNEVDARMSNTCALMKAQGIIIYALTFGPSPDAQAQATFSACATQPNSPYYIHAPTNADLADAFRTIGTALSNLRIAE